MGIFSPIVKNAYEGFDSEITGNVTLEQVEADESLANVFDKSMDLSECGLQAVIDINENYNMIEKSLMGNELVYMEQTGQEFQYTEAICEGFIDSIRNFLKKVWEKIKALFHRFMMKIDSYMKNDKEFVTKYKKDIYSGKDLTDFTFKGYVFTTSNLEKAITMCGIDKTREMGIAIDQMDKNADYNPDLTGAGHVDGGDNFKNRNEKYGDKADAWRAKVANAAFVKGNAGSSLDAGEFRKALFEAFRNGESEKEELDHINLGDYATELMTSRQAKKDLNQAFKASDRTIKDAEKICNNVAKEYKNLPADDADKDTKEAKTKLYTGRVAGANYYLKWVHLSSEMLTTVNAEGLRAINDRSRQYKACIVKAVAHKGNNESAIGESYTPTQSGSFLADLALR